MEEETFRRSKKVVRSLEDKGKKENKEEERDRREGEEEEENLEK